MPTLFLAVALAVAPRLTLRIGPTEYPAIPSLFSRDEPSLALDLRVAQVGASAATSLPAAAHYDVIRTKEGKVRVGQILQETEKGYLFRSADGETTVIEFGAIDDIQRTGGAGPPPQGTGRPGPVAPPPPPMPPSYVPPPAYPAPYPVDPLAIEKERKRLHLETTLRELESRLAQVSYGTALFEVVAGAILVGLALFVFSEGDGFRLVLLIGGGINLTIGAVRTAFVAYDRSKLGEQIDATKAELARMASVRPSLATPGLVTLLEF